MATTYQLISSVTVGSGGAASIDFTSIPATYTDLVLKFSGRGTNAATALGARLQFNGATTSYSERVLYGTGAAAASVANNSGDDTGIFFNYIPGANATASTFGNGEIYIPNYAGSNNKSLSSDTVTENNSTTAYTMMTAGLRANTAAITQVTLTPSTGNFAQYSTAYLYGIKNS